MNTAFFTPSSLFGHQCCHKTEEIRSIKHKEWHLRTSNHIFHRNFHLEPLGLYSMGFLLRKSINFSRQFILRMPLKVQNLWLWVHCHQLNPNIRNFLVLDHDGRFCLRDNGLPHELFAQTWCELPFLNNVFIELFYQTFHHLHTVPWPSIRFWCPQRSKIV